MKCSSLRVRIAQPRPLYFGTGTFNSSSFIGKNAFAHVPSVSRMDLSNNRILRIDNNAFKEVGNALKFLKISNALYFTTLPNIAFHALSTMEVLDLVSCMKFFFHKRSLVKYQSQSKMMLYVSQF